MRYLTVHDVIWINTAVAGSPQRYDFNRLENAVYSQYAYGQSRDALAQGARLLARLLRDKPFAQGNELTALVAAMVFLRLNGYTLQMKVQEVQTVLAQLEQGQLRATELFRQQAQPATPEEDTLRQVVGQVFQQLHLPMRTALAGVH